MAMTPSPPRWKRDGKLKNLAIFGGMEIPEKVLIKQNAFKKLVITC